MQLTGIGPASGCFLIQITDYVTVARTYRRRRVRLVNDQTGLLSLAFANTIGQDLHLACPTHNPLRVWQHLGVLARVYLFRHDGLP